MYKPTQLPALRRSSNGLATTEWLVSATALLITLSLSIEINHWFVLRQHLTLHAQRAVDYAALTGGSPKSVHQHLKQNLRPRSLHLGHVCVMDDVSNLLKDFKDLTLSQERGRAVIRHNHIAAQHERNLAKGWPRGKGPKSHKTISQANVLHVSVVAYQPVSQAWLRAIVGHELKLRVITKSIMQSPREKISRGCIGF